MTSYPWGTVSDHTGRKVCFCITICNPAAVALVETYSENVFMLIAAGADGREYLSMYIYPGPWSGAKLQCCNSFSLHWGTLHFKYWSVSPPISDEWFAWDFALAYSNASRLGNGRAHMTAVLFSMLLLYTACYNMYALICVHFLRQVEWYTIGQHMICLLLRCCRAIKTIIAESCDATNQAKAMGYMTAGWGVGTIAGPTIGGFLANPCSSFASGSTMCAPGSWLLER